ncbi:protein of unknown function [Cupriavidus neocaledonicus]|uniref:Uncharacterized protein n=1 Tax=Cupriavidus neocaledonicus TaxID=1040979 RepID=A0A375HAA5_9BURK|nr:hypothetical protein CBM2605_A170103 [Cupriavidus neocaledonicus]SPD47130.1 protein of unknown function [Cupriavidus neocaledonicus]
MAGQREVVSIGYRAKVCCCPPAQWYAARERLDIKLESAVALAMRGAPERSRSPRFLRQYEMARGARAG